MEKIPEISLFFPVYRDATTVRRVAEKARMVLAEVAERFEIIIVNDGCPDGSGEVANTLAEEYAEVRVIHHESNLGYGMAFRSGLEAAQYQWICQTDGDDEYEVWDLLRLLEHHRYYDLIITFRFVKLYSSFRVFVSWVYNVLVRWMFRTRFRDISTGLRLVRKEIVDRIQLESTSPFIGAELTIKAMVLGYRIGEVGIQTFPREFGRGSSVSLPNILATIRDLFRANRRIFSRDFCLPSGRPRRPK